MKLDRLLEFTRQPELLSGDESEDIETLLQEYPYFSAAQLLLTIKYKQQNSSRFNRQLQRAAAHLPDKNVLATALHEGLAQMQLLESLVDTNETVKATTETELKPDVEVLASTTGTIITETTINAEVVEIPETASVEVEGTVLLPEVEVEAIDLTTAAAVEVEWPIETEKLEAAVETKGLEIEEVEATVDTIEEKIAEWPIEEEVKSPVAAASKELAHLEQTVSEMQHSEEDVQEVFLTQAHDRLSWFRFFAGKPLREQPDDVLEELYLEHMSGDFLQAESATLPEIKSELKAIVNHDAEVAQNKNLEEEIRRLAYESISDEELPASETLAAIYESQKDYKKALRIYQKLMLKFPDRMTYFAGLVAITKEKLNN